jgi:DNA-binding transcriptional regulator YiaG
MIPWLDVSMKTKTVRIEVVIPKLDGAGEAERVPVEVLVQWDDELQEWLMTPEAHERIETTKARYLGLLLPGEIKALRQRLGLTQAEICELLQIGEKTWTRWENGRERPSRVLNVLLCALRDGKLDLPYLRRLAARRQNRAAAPFQSGNLTGSPGLKTVQDDDWEPVHPAIMKLVNQLYGSFTHRRVIEPHVLPHQILKNVIPFQIREPDRSAAAQASPCEIPAGTLPTDEHTLAA